MGADVIGFLSVVAMGIFTVFAIIGGYLLLNTAVTNLAKESAYYSYIRVSEAISSSMQNKYSSATNLQFNPRYVIFSAYFTDASKIPFYIFEGQRFNNIAVNLNDMTFFNQVVSSSTGQSRFNEGAPGREELKNCIGDACICIAEMTTFLLVENEYIIPNACVEICWGENPSSYDACLSTQSASTPRQLMTTCNNIVGADSANDDCKRCVDYMNNFGSNMDVASGNGYNVLRLKSSTMTNSQAYTKLKEFSEATKFSFFTNIIECRSMSELAGAAAKNGFCTTQRAPYLFNFTSDDSGGLFSILTTSQVLSGEVFNYNTLMELFNLEYYQDDTLTPTKCQTFSTYVKTSKTEASV